MRAAVAHDVDASWLVFRADCHRRIREYVTRVHEGAAPKAAYAATYDAMTRRGRVASEEEDTSTFRGGFYRAVVKMFDVTIDDRRIQGYNALADRDEMRDYVFRKFDPDALADALASKRLLVHGGNGAWPRQQIATDLLRSDAIEGLVMALAFGVSGESCATAADDEVARRLEAFCAADAKALALGTKVLHVFAPARWPALTPKTTPEAGAELGSPIPAVDAPRGYLAFAGAMREIAQAKGHADLDRTDVVVADAHDSATGG
jgi:hypothetical protein